MSENQLRQYADIYHRAIPTLGRGFDAKSQTGLRDMDTHRRLCHATVSSDLDHFFHEEVASTGKRSLERWLSNSRRRNVCYYAELERSFSITRNFIKDSVEATRFFVSCY